MDDLGAGRVSLVGTVDDEEAVAGPVVGIVGGGAFTGSPDFFFGGVVVVSEVGVCCGGGRLGCCG